MRLYPALARIFVFMLLSFGLLLAACGQTPSSSSTSTPAAATSTPTVARDAYGTPITMPTTTPQRIVSLVPSTSEELAALGLESHIVAVDYYTDYPASLTSKPKISDANAKYDVEKIIRLKPDLILSYGAETKQYDSQLKSVGLNVVDLPLANFSQSLQQILLIGRLTSTQDAASKLYNQLQQQIDQIKTTVAGTTAPKTMIELDDTTPGKPYVFGGGSFGDNMLQLANATNIFHNDTSGQGFPQVTDEAIISANPQIIILTDANYGGGVGAVYKRANWGGIDAVKSKQVYGVNSNLLSRPGPRLVQGLQCVAQIVHHDKFSGTLPSYCSSNV
jgi:iron complex transport system substrate-binding protein